MARFVIDLIIFCEILEMKFKSRSLLHERGDFYHVRNWIERELGLAVEHAEALGYFKVLVLVLFGFAFHLLILDFVHEVHKRRFFHISVVRGLLFLLNLIQHLVTIFQRILNAVNFLVFALRELKLRHKAIHS